MTERALADDIALAASIVDGDQAAIAMFEKDIAFEIEAAIKKVDRDRTFVAETAQRVRIKLLVGDGPASPPKIASYRGTGPLRAWVSIAALRVALNAKRDAAPPPTSDDDILADLVDREPDPELRHLTALYRAAFREALTAALTALPNKGRALLRMRFVAGLELAQIGKLYRVHESTASRWIQAAVDAVGDDARARLVAKLSITPDTADSVARMVKSQLDLSIARLLK
jgi:RNA polymerase sigma-70 factor (ECF subfamily)